MTITSLKNDLNETQKKFETIKEEKLNFINDFTQQMDKIKEENTCVVCMDNPVCHTHKFFIKKLIF